MFQISTRLGLFLLALLLLSCNKKDTKLPKIAIAGIAIESSTFSPAKTEESRIIAATRKGGKRKCLIW